MEEIKSNSPINVLGSKRQLKNNRHKSQPKAEIAQILIKQVQDHIEKQIESNEQVVNIKKQDFDQITGKSRIQNKQSSKSNRMFRSNLTSQEQLQIKKIIKKHRKFQDLLEEKNQILNEKISNIQEKEKHHKLQILHENCQERKLLLAQQHAKLLKRKEERKIQQKESRKILGNLRNQSYLYEELEGQNHEIKEKQKFQLEEKLKNIKQDKKLNLKAISEHEKQYLQKLQEIKNIRQKQLQEHAKINRISSLPRIYSNFYMQSMKEEYEQFLEVEKKNIQKAKNIQKQKQYGQKVKECYLPKIRGSSKESKQYQTRILHQKSRIKQMSHAELHNIGNSYMQNAHANITKQLIEKENKNQELLHENENNLEQGKNSVLYKNYLKQLKAKSRSKNSSKKLSKQVLKVITNNDFSSIEKFERAKYIVKAKQHKITNDNELVDNIKSKIMILREMVQ